MTGAAVFVSYDSGTKPNFSLAGGRTQSQMFWIDGGAGQNHAVGHRPGGRRPAGGHRPGGEDSQQQLRGGVRRLGRRRHHRHDEVRHQNVPTEAQRRGDFAQTFDARGSQIVIYDPAPTPGQARTPFPGNVIPQNRLDPVGLRIAALYPLPNRPGDNISGANNFGANGTSTLARDNYMVKVEHTIRGNDKITGRYLYNSDNSLQTSVFPEPAADSVSEFLRHQNYFYVGYTRTFGSALVNEVRYYSRNGGARSIELVSRGVRAG